MENINSKYTFSQIDAYSPVDSQKFVWLAEYFDNTGLSEIDYDTKKENKFKDIDKEKLIYFGLVGNGNKLKFSSGNGLFNLNGKTYNVTFKDIETDTEYVLSGNSICDASDIISFKKAHADMRTKRSNATKIYTAQTVIDAFYFGYKNQITFKDGFKISYKPIVCIPINERPHIEISISGSDNKSGELIIKKNNTVIDTIKTSIIKNVTMKLNWFIK